MKIYSKYLCEIWTDFEALFSRRLSVLTIVLIDRERYSILQRMAMVIPLAKWGGITFLRSATEQVLYIISTSQVVRYHQL